tara:strand:+ start:538 stop:702 length:165 start_codon:yes stop_codon:yes gene_type:complete
MKKSEHIGFPLPSEMFHDIPVVNKDEEWDKHVKISKLLDIPLKCPNCGEVLRNA